MNDRLRGILGHPQGIQHRAAASATSARKTSLYFIAIKLEKGSIFLNKIEKEYPFLSAHIKQAKVFLKEENQTLCMNFITNFHYELVNEDKNKKIINEILNTYQNSPKLIIKYEDSLESKNLKTLSQIEKEQQDLEQQKLLKNALAKPLIIDILEVFKDSAVSIKSN